LELSTIIGLVLGMGALAMSVIMEGGDLGGLASISALIIVVGGTMGATMTSFSLKQFMLMPKLLIKAMLGKKPTLTPATIVPTFVSLAERARREGLLSLEEEAGKLEDPFVRKGMLMVVDGIDPEVVKDVLETDIGAMAERHAVGYGIFEAMGGFSPTMGILGTVMGLVRVLSNLSNPNELSAAIAVAFIATLYGVGLANLVWLPIGAKLKGMSKQEVWLREVSREGILSVQAGDNPRIVREKLEAYLAMSARGEKAAKASGKVAGAPVEEEAVPAAGGR
jgi:chemotaxis protein MotA